MLIIFHFDNFTNMSEYHFFFFFLNFIRKKCFGTKVNPLNVEAPGTKPK
jgi:hypothetical protein